ncbi:IS66 family insertion sequence element accessory protein TnpB [Bradyrhizobium sp. 183]|nr:IS66 family insertion sequence element accessory protein TnpB [Bradyrhizobium sp. 184]UPJ87563.1 IS66 family insertion sequence element accessory protein TnpB [Bradyrhizobium sp. 183]
MAAFDRNAWSRSIGISGRNPRNPHYYKRIEGQFTWPPIKEGVMPLSHAQLSVLLDGSDWKRVPMRVVDQPARAG